MTSTLRSTGNGAPGAESGSTRRERRRGADVSDAELIDRTRAGQADAYGALYQRHVDAVRRLARRLSHNDAEADDVTSEVFAKTLRAIRGGNGPTDDALPYLLRSVRHCLTSARVNGDTGRAVPVPDDELDRAMPFAAPETSDVSEAFIDLSDRFRHVLWWTEVEGATPGQLSRDQLAVDGVSAGAAASLSHRARCALRRSYLRSATRRSCEFEACRNVGAAMPAVALGQASAKQRTLVEHHTVECEDCATTLADMSRLASTMSTRSWFGWLIGWIGNLGASVRSTAMPGAVPVLIATTIATVALTGDVERDLTAGPTVEEHPALPVASDVADARALGGSVGVIAPVDATGTFDRVPRSWGLTVTDDAERNDPVESSAASTSALAPPFDASQYLTAMNGAPTPLGTATGAIGGFGLLGGNGDSLGEGVGSFAGAVTDGLDDAIDGTIGSLGELLDGFVPGAGNVLAPVSDVADELVATVDHVVEPLTAAVDDLTTAVAPATTPLADAAGEVTDPVVTIADETLDAVADTVGTLDDTLGGQPEPVPEPEPADDPGVVGGLVDAVTSLLG